MLEALGEGWRGKREGGRAGGRVRERKEEGEEYLTLISGVHTNTTITTVWEARHNEAQTASYLLCNLSHTPSTGQPGVEGSYTVKKKTCKMV